MKQACASQSLDSLDPPSDREAAALGKSDDSFLARLRAHDPKAMEQFFDTYSGDVLRILRRVLGSDVELADLVQEVFVRAFDKVHQVRDPSALRSWLVAIAVFVGRECIRRRKRGWWLRLFSSDSEETQVPPQLANAPDWEARQALAVTFSLLDRMSVDDRIAFSLRFLEGMELVQVAQACGVSLATIKRRLSKAQSTFFQLAQSEPALQPWIERGAGCEVV